MKILAYVLSVIFFIALAGLYGTACWFDYGLWAIAVWAAMIFAIPLCSLLHELGHMLFGAMCGIKAKPHFSLFGSSSCEVVPKKENNLKTRMYFTAFGGIIVNVLIFGVIGLLVNSHMLPYYCSFLMPANAYLAILNVIPAQLGNGATDGLVAAELIKNTDTAKVMLAVLAVQAQVLNGKPIEEVDEKLLFDLPVIQEDDQSFIALTELRYEYFKAKGNEEQAEKYRQRYEDLKQYLN